MRDPKRIDRILNLLKECWNEVPDWRFGQIISNIFGNTDLFYMEDGMFEEEIRKFFKK